jgi:hypothetical protein
MREDLCLIQESDQGSHICESIRNGTESSDLFRTYPVTSSSGPIRKLFELSDPFPG